MFFEFLQVALGNRSCLSRTLAADEWLYLYEESQRHALKGIAFMGLSRLPKEQRPGVEVLANWYHASEMIKKQSQLLNKRAAEACQFFWQEGIDCCVMKGQAVARFYSDPLLRNSGDIDLWVNTSPQNLQRVAQKHGLNLSGRNYIHYHFPLFDDVEVEAHFRPSYFCNPMLNRRLQRYFEQEKAQQFASKHSFADDSGFIGVPTLKFDYIYILLHIARHFFSRGIGLRQFLDYYYVMQQPISEAERENVIMQLRRFKLQRLTKAVMYVLQQVFGLENQFLLVEPDVAEGEFLLREVMRSGNFGDFDDRLRPIGSEPALMRFSRSMRRNAHFVFHYPSEMLWVPLFRTKEYLQRQMIK